MDNSRVPHFNHEIVVGSLETVLIGNEEFIPFLLDINESATNDNRLLSLDDVKIFTTAATAVSDKTLAELLADPRLSLRYNMDAGGNNSVLLDYTRIGRGSGAADMAMLIPKSLLAGVSATDTLYLYSRFGGDISEGDADAGYEEWTLGEGSPVIPEPGSATLLGICAMGALLRRRR